MSLLAVTFEYMSSHFTPQKKIRKFPNLATLVLFVHKLHVVLVSTRHTYIYQGPVILGYGLTQSYAEGAKAPHQESAPVSSGKRP